MAFANYMVSVPFDVRKLAKNSLLTSSPSLSIESSVSESTPFSSLLSGARKVQPFPTIRKAVRKGCCKPLCKFQLQGIVEQILLRPTVDARASSQDSEATVTVDAFTKFKHLLLPVTDRNPYLSEGTRQAAATTAALAKKYGADITVVLIDEKQKDSLPEHETQLSTIRWHLSQGGFQEFKLLERLGEGSQPTAIIGEVADELNLDLVVLSMEAIHSKFVDANLLAEFIPCPVMLLPL